MSDNPRWRTDNSFLLASADFFQRNISYDADSGNLTWLKRLDGSRGSNAFNARYACNTAGRLHPEGYVIIVARVMGKPSTFMGHRVAWLMHHGEWPMAEVDHINQDKKDNKAKNLRLINRQGNCRNSSISIKNKTGHTGVSLHSDGKRYVASVMINYKHVHLGTFECLERAALAASNARASAGFDPSHGEAKK